MYVFMNVCLYVCSNVYGCCNCCFKSVTKYISLNLILTLTTLNYFKNYKRYINIFNHVLDLAYPK